MLNIITGRTGSGKTRLIRSMAAEIATKESDKTIIIVPEQFSFETEKGMLQLLGNDKINNIEILSFSRIAERLLSRYGKMEKKTADDGVRAVLMSCAIETLEDKLTVFNRYKKFPQLINEILDFHREIKKCGITNESLDEFSNLVNKSSFSSKLSELSQIFSCYDALMSQNFCDSCTYPDMLYELLWDVDYFKGKTVFIDAFSGFSGQEYKIIEQILRQAENVYVTFCCDTSKNNNRYELFYNVSVEIKKLKQLANKINVKIASENVLYSKKEFKKDELNFLEDNIFSSDSKTYEEKADAITVIPCRTKTDECQVVASEIKKLIRTENLRYRDIAVIVRNEDSYKKNLESAFRKYDIDCFDDNRQPVNTQPLVVFVKCLLNILVKGFDIETVLRFLKTQLYGFTVEEIALLEDYCLMWRVSPSQWKNEWTENPKGLGETTDEETERLLNQINSLRERVVGPVLSLKKKITDTDGETVSKELFAFLRNAHIDENLKSFTTFLKDSNENDLALEQGRIWKLLTEVLDGLYGAVGKNTITIERYSELFDILVASKNIGVIPNGMDEVTIGSADRIRASAPKVVFLMGVNTGIFPGESSSGVLFNNTERCELIKNGLPIISNLEYNSVSENFIAYRAITLATDRVYLTYSAVDSDSSSLTSSEMVNDVVRMFPKCVIRKESTKLDLVESRDSAFSVVAGESVNGSVLGETLRTYFQDNDGENELSKIEKANKRDFKIKNTELAEKFFGKNMYMSASRIEKFYKCPFGYFCEYGMKLKPRKEAQVDAALYGTVIHFVLEQFLFKNKKTDILNMSEMTIKEKINIIIDEYITDEMGGYDNKAQSFLRTIKLIKDTAYGVVFRLVDEFRVCEFTPVDFELKINNDGDISPYVVELQNGGTVSVVGSIDRVDMFKTEDNTFIRVVDYKTGGKEFQLGEVFYGLNMQMLIYLFAIWENGKEHYGDNITPAGVLYFQAKNTKVSSDKVVRDSDVEDAQAYSSAEHKMDGMILNNLQVFEAMDKNYKGIFLPASFDEKTGSLKGKVISLSSFERLKNSVNSSIKDMAEKLQSGYISALPVEDGCKWCNYKDVCKREEDDPVKEMEILSFKDSITMLRRDEDGKNMD
ncbi:MAG: exodeoxyribonuclease V subunit gamma [Clostridia bacterium]|nr:exodeoxyribonuclease V subunit gamma [Clostridia bacterium]